MYTYSKAPGRIPCKGTILKFVQSATYTKLHKKSVLIKCNWEAELLPDNISAVLACTVKNHSEILTEISGWFFAGTSYEILLRHGGTFEKFSLGWKFFFSTSAARLKHFRRCFRNFRPTFCLIKMLKLRKHESVWTPKHVVFFGGCSVSSKHKK